jgi:8-oxo-dGTP pyrophosphatase MutT (NUDIX family)
MQLEVLRGADAFKIRAAALIVRDGRVLLNSLRGPDEPWMLPGGTGEFGETAEATLRRELREELGVDVRVGRLVWVVEHFFPLNGRCWHQLLWLHEATLPDDCGLPVCDAWTSETTHDVFRWTPFGELRALRLLPGFLADAVGDLPAAPRHVVHVDR